MTLAAALAQVLPEAIQLKSVETLPVDFGARPAGSVLSVALRCAAHGALLSDDCCCAAADLGVLFCLDADRDGMVTLSEMRAFMLLCALAPPLAACERPGPANTRSAPLALAAQGSPAQHARVAHRLPRRCPCAAQRQPMG